jgi:hypothetical protein
MDPPLRAKQLSKLSARDPSRMTAIFHSPSTVAAMAIAARISAALTRGVPLGGGDRGGQLGLPNLWVGTRQKAVDWDMG